ncbi:unnamed protein product [Bursaphelenchus xylophilus]|uniref:(pine wood nematode) hypothetical protein n=1 Tax=Bursaphelenchus xylophilus TaxID=6326 RepID=A0A1I7S502_BURXY|nr:unnamed protein product [Bursaphelenchus xylophilus]CAG9117553.1 unnamed protein product [Bursaphelenchus xylophilus]
MWDKLNTNPITQNVKVFQFNYRVSYPEEAVIFYENTFLPRAKQDELPIIFHTFSNNGAAALMTLWGSMEKSNPEIKKRIKGILFDSGPAPIVTILPWARAFYSTQIPAKYQSSFTYFLSLVVFVPFVALRNLYVVLRDLLQPGYRASRDAFIGLPALDLPKNQMFLYSTADLMCYHTYIRKFHDNQASKGTDVEYKMWTDTSHVAHHIGHQEEYEKLCQKFLNKCLRK